MHYTGSSIEIRSNIELSNYLTGQTKKEIIEEIFRGLTANQKHISSRFFYDKTGSALFERITELTEYYLTRTEQSILKNIAPKITDTRNDLAIIELGSGNCTKISTLLDTLTEEQLNSTWYYPVDISESAILNSGEILSRKYPGLNIHGFLADFMKHLRTLPGEGNRLLCFFGSTIGNLSREESYGLLKGLGDLMLPGDSILLGLDMVKDVKTLEAAYNDSGGVTAAFNLNILYVINNLADTDFIPGGFRHSAFYNPGERKIEMHLQAIKTMEINSPLFPQRITIQKGETIHTENSNKFTNEDIYQLAENSDLEMRNIYTDKKGWFALVHFNMPENPQTENLIQ